jgi:hypothetical protein
MKSKGTIIAEETRKVCNKLSIGERAKLLKSAMEIINQGEKDPHIIFENWGKSPITQILTVSIFEWEDGWVVESGRFAWFTKSKKELDKFMKRYSI